ncbi:hypothetical protein MCBMB27_02091 [Methylobacterium phyllosphaerae]|uniref:Uncharacterized protein n=1 Tax=Methylobacterium phyllosphaerae TaxID=418223 RepID=A0AAE8HQ31_9HYPH|nr:hypothetical protein MCBMB27_02091 [Methylobacterium phyllosphaerae]SFG64314.1 hypothetical protein SAMN05192567_10640 [Methylobacterium phyllosphaerae]
MNIDESSNLIRVVIPPVDPNAPPVKRPPSSRTIARLREKAEVAARDAAAARSLRARVQSRLRPPAGRLFAVDAAALVIQGPAGGLGSSERIVRTLAPLAAGGRHPAAALVAAGGWQDEAALREALSGLGPKLAALGLRICRRKAGLRMAKVKGDRACPARQAPGIS